MVTASDSQCQSRNCPRYDNPMQHPPTQCRICGAADKAVLNKVLKKNLPDKFLRKSQITEKSNSTF
jgi:hypothetical protein